MELVYQGANNQAITSSLMVAEKFGKRHKDVLERIRNLMAENSAVTFYEKTTYINSRHQEQPMCIMNRDGFTLLAMSFSGKEALSFKLDYINAFNLMENHIREEQSKNMSIANNIPQTFSQALLLAAKQQEAIEEQQKMLEAKDEQIHEMTNAIAEMQTKVSYVDHILASKATVTVTQIAQDYGMSAKAFNKILADLHIQRKVNSQWILYGEYLNGGYVQSKPVDIIRTSGMHDTIFNTEWTQKGRLFLYETLKKKEILPLIEQ